MLLHTILHSNYFNSSSLVSPSHSVNFRSGSIPSGWSYTRPDSVSTYWDNTGKLKQAAVDEMLFDYPTRDGVLKGLKSNKPSTNLLECYNANPTDMTGWNTFGNGTISVVDSPVSLAAVGLDQVCSSGKVYMIDNSGETAATYVESTVATTNTQSYSLFAYFLITTGTGNNGTFGLGFDSDSGVKISRTGDEWSKVTLENLTPTQNNRPIRIKAYPGQVVYFILPQLERKEFSSYPIITTGAAATTSAHQIKRTDIATQTWWNNDTGAVLGIYILQATREFNQYQFFASEDQGFTNNYAFLTKATNGQGGARDQGGGNANLFFEDVHAPVKDELYPWGLTWGATHSTAAAGAMRYVRKQRVNSVSNINTLQIGGRSTADTCDGWLLDFHVFNQELTLADMGRYMIPQNAIVTASGGQSNKHGMYRAQGDRTNEGERRVINAYRQHFGSTAIDLPLFMMNGAENGSSINDTHDNAWYDLASDTFQVLMDRWEEMAIAVGVDKIQSIDWDQGESNTNLTTAQYKTCLLKVLNKMRAIVGPKPVIVTNLGRRSGSESSGYVQISKAYTELALEYDWIHLAPEKFTQELVDTVHYTSEGYGNYGEMLAPKILDVRGETVTQPVDGSTIDFSRSGTTLTGTISYNSGASDFTGGSNLPFSFFDNGVEIALSNFQKISTTQFTLDLASTPSGTEEVYYIYGTESDCDATYDTAFLIDNSIRNLPIQRKYQVLN